MRATVRATVGAMRHRSVPRCVRRCGLGLFSANGADDGKLVGVGLSTRKIVRCVDMEIHGGSGRRRSNIVYIDCRDGRWMFCFIIN